MNRQETDVHNGEAPASRTPDSGDARDRAISETVGPLPANPVSVNKLEANRRNALQSTGPKTDAGKAASRLNALKHGLLTKEAAITRGAYQEDEQEFAQLLNDLREQFTPVGVAEDLEVQKIALCYWRKMRAVRYEHGVIRKRTGDLREREELSREERFDLALRDGSNLEDNSRGIQYLIDGLEEVKQEVLQGTLPRESREWLKENFPDEFAPPDQTQVVGQAVAGTVASKDYARQMMGKIDAQLRRLSPMREKLAAIEEMNLESKISATALPGSGMVDKLVRYETSNDRELDRALKRLEGMQERRRKQGGAPPEK